MSPTSPTDSAALRHHGLPITPVAMIALATALLFLQWRTSFLVPLAWWVAEAFGPLR